MARLGDGSTGDQPLLDVTAVLEHAPLAVARVKDRVGLWCNQRLTDMLGWTLDELRGSSTRRLFVDEASWSEFGARASTGLRDSPECMVEHPFRHQDGHVVQVRAHGRRGAAPGEVIWFLEDITVQRDQEHRLAEKRELLDTYFRSPTLGIALSELGAGVIDVNPTLCGMLGYTREELLSIDFRRLTYPEDAAEELAAVGRLASGEVDSCSLEKRYVRKDGTTFWGMLSLSVSRSGSTGRIRILGMVKDIQRRKEAELALARSEERLRSVFTAMAEGVVLQDQSGRIVLCNEAAERILGLTRAQMEGRDSLDPRWRAIHDDGSPFPGETHPGMVTLRTGQPLSGVVMGVETPEGVLRWISISSEPLGLGASGGASAVVATFTDITELRRNQELLRQREEQLERVLRGSNDVFFDWNPAADAVMRSRRVTEMLGLPADGIAPTRDAFLARVHPEDAPGLRAAIDLVAEGRAETLEREYRARAADGSWRWLLTRARRSQVRAVSGEIHVAGTITDVTERRRAQVVLTNAESGRLVTQLAGGIAHDYNNLLTTILANAEFLDDVLPHGSQQAEDLASIRHAAQRAAELTRQLLSYGQRQVLMRRDVDAAALVRGLVPLFHSLCGAGTEVAVHIAESPLSLWADRNAVEQALLSLVMNAHEAMPGGGHLTIVVDRIDLGEGDPALGRHARPGTFVRLSVTDTGTGIAPELLPHLFEPFFSTKDAAAGAGLGLASVDGAMAQSGGAVTIDTEVGRGTTVTLLVPAAT